MIKEKFGKVAPKALSEETFITQPDKESKDKDVNNYLLPDGNTIYISPQLVEEAAEVLF